MRFMLYLSLCVKEKKFKKYAQFLFGIFIVYWLKNVCAPLEFTKTYKINMVDANRLCVVASGKCWKHRQCVLATTDPFLGIQFCPRIDPFFCFLDLLTISNTKISYHNLLT